MDSASYLEDYWSAPLVRAECFPHFPSDGVNAMRKLTTKQLQRLRSIAVASLELPKPDRPDLGIAPEDLIVACNVALGHDALEDEDEDERRALIETYHRSCAETWRRRSSRKRVTKTHLSHCRHSRSERKLIWYTDSTKRSHIIGANCGKCGMSLNVSTPNGEYVSGPRRVGQTGAPWIPPK